MTRVANVMGMASAAAKQGRSVRDRMSVLLVEHARRVRRAWLICAVLSRVMPRGHVDAEQSPAECNEGQLNRSGSAALHRIKFSASRRGRRR
jgi:hypothetical protein